MWQRIKLISKRQKALLVGIITFSLVGCYLLVSANGMSGDNGYYNLTIIQSSVSTSELDNSISRTTVDISLKNTGKEVLQVSPGLQMFLETESGKVYNMTARYLGKDEVIGGPIAIDGTANMAVDFDIPSTETPKSFTFQPDLSKPLTVLGL